jgi:hypothetical protein
MIDVQRSKTVPRVIGAVDQRSAPTVPVSEAVDNTLRASPHRGTRDSGTGQSSLCAPRATSSRARQRRNIPTLHREQIRPLLRELCSLQFVLEPRSIRAPFGTHRYPGVCARKPRRRHLASPKQRDGQMALRSCNPSKGAIRRHS